MKTKKRSNDIRRTKTSFQNEDTDHKSPCTSSMKLISIWHRSRHQQQKKITKQSALSSIRLHAN